MTGSGCVYRRPGEQPGPEGGLEPVRGLARSDAVAPQHSGGCSFPHRGLCAVDGKETTMSTEPQPAGVRFPAGERRGGGAEARFLTVRAQKCLGPWFPAA